MSLRDIFITVLRDKFYVYLKQGSLRTWSAEVIYSIVDGIIREKEYEINSYLQNYIVNLENMDGAADSIVRSILLPYLQKKRVE